MTEGMMIAETLLVPNIFAYITGILVNYSWDKYKAKKSESYEYLLLQAIAESFKAFYKKKNLEYDEEIVMASFMENVDASSSSDRAFLSAVSGIEFSKQDVEEWKNQFVIVITQERYAPVYKKVLMSSNERINNSEAYRWMQKNVKDNFCSLSVSGMEAIQYYSNMSIIKALSEITPLLGEECWMDTQALLSEIYLNAFTHGMARNCEILVEHCKITLIDDGHMFDSMLLKEGDIGRGGSTTLISYCDLYDDIEISSERFDNKNHFIINFKFNVFDINAECKLEGVDLNIFNRDEWKKKVRQTYKYQYVDMGDFIDDEDMISSGLYMLLNVSSQIRLFPTLAQMVADDGKIYFIFPKILSGKLKSIRRQMQMTLYECKMSEKLGARIEIIDL